jgi:hypothetical protein
MTRKIVSALVVAGLVSFIAICVPNPAPERKENVMNEIEKMITELLPEMAHDRSGKFAMLQNVLLRIREGDRPSAYWILYGFVLGSDFEKSNVPTRDEICHKIFLAAQAIGRIA